MKNLVGPPVTGDNFYGREKELKDAMFLLEQGNSLLMASPRRVGKSSFAKKLTELCKNRNFKCIYLDLQGIADEQEFGDRIAESFRKIMKEESRLYGLIDNVGHFLNKVKKVDIKGVGLEFKDGAERFYNEVENLVDNVSKKRVLVVIDELAVFLQRIEEQSGISSVESILNWLRKLRQKNQGHIVWVFCSSVSITNFASKNNLSYTINDLTPFRLGEMSYNEASGLLRLLCEGQNADPFSADETDVILRKIGWKLPFFIQLFFNCYQHDREEYCKSDIDSATDKIIFQIIGEHQLSSWSERLTGYGKYEKPAQLLLNYLCLPEHRSGRSHLETIISQACSTSEDLGTIYSEVKQMLETDGYIMESTDGDIVFRSPIIRQYWFNKFVK